MRCPDCDHWHDGRMCDVIRVSGPPVDTEAWSAYRPDQHTGRTLTRCGCTNQPAVNGDSTSVPPVQLAQPESD